MSAYNETIGDVDWMKWEEVKAHTKLNFFFLALSQADSLKSVVHWKHEGVNFILFLRNEDVFI